MDKEKLLTRLRRIRGQIEGIERMIENERECEDILMQIKASQKGLLRFGEEMLKCNLDVCLAKKMSSKDMKKKVEVMVKSMLDMK